jgi:hypothetical protein
MPTSLPATLRTSTSALTQRPHFHLRKKNLRNFRRKRKPRTRKKRRRRRRKIRVRKRRRRVMAEMKRPSR